MVPEALTPLDRFGGIDGWRRAIRDGTYTAADFRRDAPSCHWRTVHELFCGTKVEAAEVRPADCVHYVASDPAAALEAIDTLALSEGDVLYELGSGLGFVAHLAAFLTRATIKAVEYDSAYHASAKEAAAGLGLLNVEHIHADAASLTYDDATAFYLFNPFRGETLAKVITAVERRARDTMVAIAVFGSSRAWHRETLAQSSSGWCAIFKPTVAHPFREKQRQVGRLVDEARRRLKAAEQRAARPPVPHGGADALAEIRRVRSEADALYQACTADFTAHEAAFFRPTNAPLSPQLSELDQRLDHAVSRARALLHDLDVVCESFEALHQAAG